MGYEGRSLLLDDGEEWVNIPIVVREFMRQLNDEAQASRSVIDSMRREQKEANQLLRRVMQKQADLEMDNARNTLSLNRVTQAPQDTTQKRHTEQIHYLRKKQERLDEKVQLLASRINSTAAAEAAAPAGPSASELASKVESLFAKVDNFSADLRAAVQASRKDQHSVESLVMSSVAAATADAESAFKTRSGDLEMRLNTVEKVGQAHQDALETQRHEWQKLRSLCSELADMIEKDRQTSKGRLDGCFQMVEKAETLYAAQRNGVEAEIHRLESAMEASLGKIRDDAKSSYVELRELVACEQHEATLRCNELAEELLSVKQQQRLLQEQVADAETDSAAVRALRLAKELSVRIGDMEASVEQHDSAYLPRREHQKLQQETQKTLDELKAAHEETKTNYQSQVQVLRQSVKALRDEQGEDNDWLHNELGRLNSILSYATQQRGKQERQVTSLCDIVHNLSVAVEALQTGRTKCTPNATGATASATPPAAAPQNSLPDGAGQSVDDVDVNVGVPPSWVAWRTEFIKDVEVKLCGASSLQQRCERLSHQLNELTAKVDGGARYTQSVATQQLEQVRQSVKDEVQRQLLAHSALRELTPALVEVEAVKRRVAGLEFEAQSAAARAEKWRGDGAGDLSDANVSNSDVLRRLVSAEDSVDGFKRRLLELSEHAITAEQQRNTTTRTVHQLELRLQDQERVVAKLGADLTMALESLLRTEESLSQHQQATASQTARARALLDEWKSEVMAFAEAKANSAASSVALASTQSTVERLQAELASATTAVERLRAEVTGELARQLRSTRAELMAIQQDGVAAAYRRCDEAISGAAAAAEAVERAQGEARSVRAELRRSLADRDNNLRVISERLAAVEAAAAAAAHISSAGSQAPVIVPESAPAPPSPSEQGAALARSTEEELRACHSRLDAQQQRLDTVAEDLFSTAAERDEATRREWQVMRDTLRDEMLAWVTTYAAAQSKKHREEMRALVDEAVRSTLATTRQVAMPEIKTEGSGDADSVETRQLVTDVQRNLEGRLAEVAAAQRKEVAQVLSEVEGMRVAHAELRREVRDTLAGQHERHEAVVQEIRDALDGSKDASALTAETASPGLPQPPTSANVCFGKKQQASPPRQWSDAAAEEVEKVARKWRDEVLQTVRAEHYSASLLEERLKNIWSSMIGLLARKEDVVAVNEKLKGLYQLMQEEMQLEMEKLENRLAGQLAGKVSLTGLQDVLEEHFADSNDQA